MREGDKIAIVGPFVPALAASELAKLRGEPLPDGLAEIDIEAVRNSQVAVREAVRAGELASAHDVAEGGAAVALAECCLAGKLGAQVELDVTAGVTSSLFGEGAGGFVVSGGDDALRTLGERTPVRVIGTVGGDALQIELGNGSLFATLEELTDAHAALRELFI